MAPIKVKKLAVVVGAVMRSAGPGPMSTGENQLNAARSSKSARSSRQISNKLNTECWGGTPARCGSVDRMSTRRSASGNGKERSNRLSTTLNTDVLAPMPSARVTTATALKPGRFRRDRSA